MIFIFSFLVFIFSLISPIQATDNKFVTIINPLRGYESWPLGNQSPLDFPAFQQLTAQKYNLPITWLLRFDFFDSEELIKGFNNIIKNEDELGIFLEITPKLAKSQNISYQSNLSWSHPQNIFLSSYNPSERIILIDAIFKKFKDRYGYYPKSVGAWNIDAYSANYLKEKYNIFTFLICSDQFTTDNYQIWGAWWGVPYYPSKKDLLIPANSLSNKLDSIVLFWAQRDPVLGYGAGGGDSTYSMQVNDYMAHHLDTLYFAKISSYYLSPKLGNFGQLTIGIENDYSLKQYGPEFKNQMENLVNKKSIFISTSNFYSWYQSQYLTLSPKTIIGDDKYQWIMSPNYRLGIKKVDSNWIVYDYRQYNQFKADRYYYTKNLANKLYWHIPGSIDRVCGIGTSVVYDANFIEKLPKDIHHIDLDLILLPLLAIIILVIFLRKNKSLILLIIVGTIFFSCTMVRSGINYEYGVGFWGPNGHDGIWHLSLINQLTKRVPPLNPIYSDTVLNNYHWGFDYLVALVTKVTYLSPVFLYFQILPVVFAIAIGLLSYLFAYRLTKDKKTSYIFTFLNYFAGSLGWLYTLIKSGELGGESLFWSMQSISTLINPPYALSLIFLLVGLIIWQKKSKKIFDYFIVGLLFGLVFAVKIYAGLLIALSFGLYFLFTLFRTKKIDKNYLLTLITIFIISLGILKLLGVLNNNRLIEFKPLWFTRSLIESLDKLYFPKLASFRANLSHQFTNPKFLIYLFVELFLIITFIVGNFYTRLLGLFALTKNRKSTDNILFILICLGLLFPLLFVQKGTAWNTIQFLYYSLFFMNLYLAKYLSTKSNKFIFIILILTILTTISTLKGYLGNPPPTSLPTYEYEALSFLKRQPGNIVLSYPYDASKKQNISTPIPLYLYETTAYVSAISSKTSYLEDEMNLDITGFDWKGRLDQSNKFFKGSYNNYQAKGFLLNNKIDYIYLVNDQEFKYQLNDIQAKKIFDNGPVKILKILK